MTDCQYTRALPSVCFSRFRIWFLAAGVKSGTGLFVLLPPIVSLYAAQSMIRPECSVMIALPFGNHQIT